MIYGNNGDSFSLQANGGGYFELRRHGLKQMCQRHQADNCGDYCSVFHRYSDGDISEVHLCCCSPPVVIRIKDEPEKGESQEDVWR